LQQRSDATLRFWVILCQRHKNTELAGTVGLLGVCREGPAEHNSAKTAYELSPSDADCHLPRRQLDSCPLQYEAGYHASICRSVTTLWVPHGALFFPQCKATRLAP
jgi:hypothetical protein